MKEMMVKAKKSEESLEFKERKELIALQEKADIFKHKLRMEELMVIRKNDELRHGHEMERQRIKSAEIRKSQERKELARMYQ